MAGPFDEIATPQDDNPFKGVASPAAEPTNTTTKIRASLGADANAEEAGKALNLSRKTGFQPEIIADNVVKFEQDSRRKEAVNAVETNPAIAAYVERNPMGAKVSNDDYEALNKISEGWRTGFGEGAITSQNRKDFPFLTTVLENSPIGKLLVGTANLFRAPMAVVGAGAAGLGAAAEAAGMGEAEAKRLTRDLFILGQGALIEPSMGVAAMRAVPAWNSPAEIAAFVERAEGRVKGAATRAEIDEFIRQKENPTPKPGEPELKALPKPDPEAKPPQVSPIAAEVISRGEMPAPGIDPLVDQFRVDATRKDLTNFQQVFDAVQESKTRERSPEAIADYLSGVVGDRTVFVPAKLVEEIYAGAKPRQGDGVFGFIPNLEALLPTMKEAGGEIEIPMRDYLAHVDKAVHDKIKDSLRLRNDGLTAEEVTALKETEAPPPVEGLRTFDTEAKALGLFEPPPPPTEPPAKGGEPPAKPEGETKAPEPTAWNLLTEGKAIGLSEASLGRYRRLLEEQEEAIVERATKAKEKEISRKRSEAWAKEEAQVRAEVETDLRSDPVLAADHYLRTGLLPSGESGVGAKLVRGSVDALIGPDKLKGLTAKVGLEPDTVAETFGFPSGKAMVEALAQLEEARGTSSPSAYRTKLIKDETEQRMLAKHGTLDDLIFEEARSAALDEHRFQVMAQELKLYAEAANVTPPMTTAEMKSLAIGAFRELPFDRGVSFPQHQRAAWGNANKVQEALLKGKFDEAFQAKQAQMISWLMAKEARAYEKESRRINDRVNQVLKEHSLPGVDQVYLEEARLMLASIGKPSPFQAPEGLPNPAQFVAASNGQLAVAPWLYSKGTPSNWSLMTVQDFMDLGDSLKSILHVGREAKKIDSVHGKADLDNVMFEVAKELDRFDTKVQPLNKSVPQRLKALGNYVTAAALLPERVLDYTDRFNPRGPLSSFLDRPLREGHAKELTLTEFAVNSLRKASNYTGSYIHDRIPNDLFKDPIEGAIGMTRNNLREVMGYAGSESGMDKLTQGYNVTEKQVRDFINANAIKEDWQWVDAMWRLYERIGEEAAVMTQRVTGVPMDRIGGHTIETDFGSFKGAYWPINYAPHRGGVENVRGKEFTEQVREGGLFGPGYKRASTPHKYTIPRTEFYAPLDIQGNFHGVEIQGQIHDIAFREPVLNAAKLIYDKRFDTMMAQKWGVAVADLFDGWLKDIANVYAVDDSYARGAMRYAAGVRQNVVSTMIAFNPTTVIKHMATAAGLSAAQVGLGPLAKSMVELGAVSLGRQAKEMITGGQLGPARDALDVMAPTGRGEAVRQFILDSSPTMRARLGLGSGDTIAATFDEAHTAGIAQVAREVRHIAMDVGRVPVAMSDAASSMATWYTAYKEAMMRDGDHAEAVYEAERVTARAHGSKFIGDKPAMLRSKNELWRWMTPLMNFFNHWSNALIQLAWDVNAYAHGRAEPGANLPSISKRIGYTIAWTLAAEQVAEYVYHKEGETLAGSVVKGAFRTIASVMPFGRDIANFATEGHDPRAGLIGTVGTTLKQVYDDAAMQASKGRYRKDFWTHMATFFGFATGIGGTQIGRTGTGIVNQATRQERPARTIADYHRLLRTGHVDPGRKRK